MKLDSRPLITFALAAVAPAHAAAAGARESHERDKVVIAYLFPRDRSIDPAQVAADKLSHVNYAFAHLRDGLMVEGFARDARNLKLLAGLRKSHPALKLLVSVGGWTSSGGFSDMAATAESRRRFVESARAFVRRHDLDGIDVDWEYPGLPGYGNTHRPEDRQRFTLLMSELRAGLDAETAETGRSYLTSLAAGAFPDFLAHTEMGEVARHVDLVNLMTYDFAEATADPIATHHACLYANPRSPKPLSAAAAVRDFLAAGVPASKLVLGVPFYGRAWGEAAGDGLFQPGRPVEIPTNFADLPVGRDGFLRRWDDVAKAPYLWNPARRIFISYEDEESLAIRCRYVLDHGLRGVMFWEYYADPTGRLLETLASGLGLSAPRRSPAPR